MKRTLFAALLIPLIASSTPAQFGGPRPKANEVLTRVETSIVPATAKRGETVTWRFEIEIVPGFHTYPTQQVDPDATSFVTKFKFPKPGEVVFVGPVIEPPDVIKKAVADPKINELRYYENKAVWERKMVVSPDAPPGPTTITVPVFMQVCDEVGCLPNNPTTTAKLTISNDPAVPVDPQYASEIKVGEAPPKAIPTPTSVDTSAPTNAAEYAKALTVLQGDLVFGDKSSAPTNTGLWSFMLTAAAWGLISLVTPCVFPMIPITVSFFLKQSEKQHLNPLLQALVYCGTIVVVLGVAALTLLRVFRDMSVHPATNIFMGALFVVLALSLFGMFELTLPNSWTRWTSSRESKGGLVGTIFMALTFTVVSFTCVAPFLGGFAGIAASGQFQWWEMALGAFAFSAAFAAPFFLLALFPSLLRKLPRSGGWLNSVKVVMGFLELAAALKFFRTAELRLLPQPEFFTYDLVLCLWIALMLICGLYLLNLFRLGHDEVQESIGVPRMLWGLAFVGLAFYLLPGIFKGGPDGERQRPGGTVFAWIDAFLLPEPTRGGPTSRDLQWSVNLPQALRQARAEHRKVFVDFTGVTCTNCKINERNVFTQPQVRDLFKQYRLVQMFTDEVPAEFYGPSSSGDLREAVAAANLTFQNAFNTLQLPLYVILDPRADGKVAVVEMYQEGKINQVNKFVEFLQRPLAADTTRAQTGK